MARKHTDPPAQPAPRDGEAEPRAALRAAVARHREGGEVVALEPGLRAARTIVAGRPELRSAPGVEALRALADELPEFAALLSAAAAEAGRTVEAAHATLWSELGLRSAPPAWGPEEREAARMVFALACVPGADAPGTGWAPNGLRRLSGAHVADALMSALADDEDLWRRVLGDRYDSLRHRCAPRTAFRSRGLTDVLAADPGCRAAVRARLERWALAGSELATLPGELEGAVVHARTPSRLA